MGKTTFLATARRVTLHIGLCDACRGRRQQILLAWYLTMAIGVLLAGVLIYLSETGQVYRENPWIGGGAMGGGLLAIGPLFLIAYAFPLLKPEFIEDNRFAVKGAGAKYLARLPEYGEDR